MEVVTRGPLPVASVAWRSWSGAASLTVVCKATYALRPLESPFADAQEPLVEADVRWGEDPWESLRFASDLVPFKRSPEVILVGSAYAPHGKSVRSITAGLCVGEVDKALEIHAERAVTLDGQLREGPRFGEAALLWHYAAGGPGTSNPVGVWAGAAPDRYGMRALPRIQPTGVHLTAAMESVPAIGFGPISPLWPRRWTKLAQHAEGWDPWRWAQRPLPDDLDRGYFNAAPADQALEAIRPNERIILDNLNRRHAHLVTSLTGPTPTAVVKQPGRADQALDLACDTMWIDTERDLCSLTFRGTLALDRADAPGTVTVVLVDTLSRARAQATTARTTVALTVGADGMPTAALPFAPAPGSATRPPSKATKPRKPKFPDPDTVETDTLSTVRSPFVAPPEGSIPGLPFRSPSMGPAPRPSEPALGPPPDGNAQEGFDSLDEDTVTEVPVNKAAQGAEPAPWEAPRGTVASERPLPPPPALARSQPLPPPPPLLGALPAFSVGRPGPAPRRPTTVEMGPLEIPMRAEPERAAGRSQSPAPPEAVAAPAPVTPVTPVTPVARVAPRPPLSEPRRPDRPAPAPLPLDAFPLPRCAAIAASLARRPGARDAILAGHELPGDMWDRLELHFADVIAQEAGRGRSAQHKAYDRAYVAQLESERGPITPDEYAAVVRAFELGSADAVLADMTLPPGIVLTLQRVFLDRMSSDPALGKSVRAALAASSDDEP